MMAIFAALKFNLMLTLQWESWKTVDFFAFICVKEENRRKNTRKETDIVQRESTGGKG